MEQARRTFLTGASVWALVGMYAVRDRLRCATRRALRVATWNLRNFEGKAPHDLQRLDRMLVQIDADVICFQEVLEPAALMQRLPDHEHVVSSHGGGHGQHLVTAWRSGVELAGTPLSDDGITVGVPVRPALVVPLRWASGTVHVVSVHLKSGPQGYSTRRRQWRRLHDLLMRVPAPRVVVGDFNTTGTGRGLAPESDEITHLAASLATSGLVRAHPPPGPSGGCTAYWDGHRYDRWKEASTLDHIFTEISAFQPAPLLQVAPGSHCERHQCQPFISTIAYPDREYESLSDHCPLFVDLEPDPRR